MHLHGLQASYYSYNHLYHCQNQNNSTLKKANKEKEQKRKTKKKQDGVNIKPVTLQDLMTKVKMVKQEIKENNSTNINEQNIAEIVNLTCFPTTDIIMTDPPLEKEISHDQEIDHNKHNILSLIDRVIFQKWHTEVTLVINKEFSLTEVALIDSEADMNCI